MSQNCPNFQNDVSPNRDKDANCAKNAKIAEISNNAESAQTAKSAKSIIRSKTAKCPKSQ